MNLPSRSFYISQHLQDGIGVRAFVQPLLFFRIFTNARVVTFPALHVSYDLKMQVWGPVAVLEAHAEFRDHFSAPDTIAFVQIF
jgi:hypothetical protein